jgi:hypothetical protein
LPTATHALRDEDSFIFRYRSPDLKKQLIMWVLAHGTVQEFHPTAAAFPFFDQYHLVHVVPRQSVWTGQQYTIKDSTFYSIAESVQTGAI